MRFSSCAAVAVTLAAVAATQARPMDSSFEGDLAARTRPAPPGSNGAGIPNRQAVVPVNRGNGGISRRVVAPGTGGAGVPNRQPIVPVAPVNNVLGRIPPSNRGVSPPGTGGTGVPNRRQAEPVTTGQRASDAAANGFKRQSVGYMGRGPGRAVAGRGLDLDELIARTPPGSNGSGIPNRQTVVPVNRGNGGTHLRRVVAPGTGGAGVPNRQPNVPAMPVNNLGRGIGRGVGGSARSLDLDELIARVFEELDLLD